MSLPVFIFHPLSIYCRSEKKIESLLKRSSASLCDIIQLKILDNLRTSINEISICLLQIHIYHS